TCRPSASVWESGRRRYLSNILGPTTLSRSDLRPATCSLEPKICSLKPRQDLPETFLERSGAQHTLLMPHMGSSLADRQNKNLPPPILQVRNRSGRVLLNKRRLFASRVASFRSNVCMHA